MPDALPKSKSAACILARKVEKVEACKLCCKSAEAFLSKTQRGKSRIPRRNTIHYSALCARGCKCMNKQAPSIKEARKWLCNFFLLSG